MQKLEIEEKIKQETFQKNYMMMIEKNQETHNKFIFKIENLRDKMELENLLESKEKQEDYSATEQQIPKTSRLLEISGPKKTEESQKLKTCKMQLCSGFSFKMSAEKDKPNTENTDKQLGVTIIK